MRRQEIRNIERQSGRKQTTRKKLQKHTSDERKRNDKIIAQAIEAQSNCDN